MTARRLAYDVLLRVERGGAFANVALDAALESAGAIDSRDRGLATELVYGTLRRALSLDWVLSQFSARGWEEVEPKVKLVLRLGAYQLLHLRVPDHAAVAETVSLAREVGVGRASGFVNALLRRVADEGREELAPPFEVDPRLHTLVEDGLPGWLYDEWSQVLDPASVQSLARAVNEPAPVTLRAASPAARDEAVDRLRADGLAVRPTTRSPVGLVLESGGAPAALPGFDSLGLQSQDEAAQLVTLYALAEGDSPLRPRQVLDPCAAPGGKACHLAQALPDARVVAADLHQRRIRRVTQEAERLGLAGRIEAHAADATRPLPFAEPASFDLILLDAPCTGLGTLQRHPEIKLNRGLEDVERLADLQRRLLDSVVSYLAPGGRLVYAVCTQTAAEGREQAAALRERRSDLVPEPIAELGPALEGLVDEDGALSTWPHRDGMDGFYAVRLRRAVDAGASSG